MHVLTQANQPQPQSITFNTTAIIKQTNPKQAYSHQSYNVEVSQQSTLTTQSQSNKTIQTYQTNTTTPSKPIITYTSHKQTINLTASYHTQTTYKPTVMYKYPLAISHQFLNPQNSKIKAPQKRSAPPHTKTTIKPNPNQHPKEYPTHLSQNTRPQSNPTKSTQQV